MSNIMKGIVDEEVGGNYLYHSVQDADTAKAILNSGYFLANRSGSQPATDAQTPYPVVSFGRNINYQTSGANVDRDYQVVFVVDRRKLEANYKTLGTSQNQLSTDKWKTMGPRWTKSYDKNGDGKLTVDELPAGIGGETLRKNYFQPKAGGEFEEAVPVKSGKLPLKGILLGFYLVPGKAASKDPELLSNPLRLDMPKPNIFVKAKQEEPVNESEEVAVIYIDGKPSAKYAKKHEAERDAEFMRKRHPNKKIEIKHEVRETEAKKGADGKRCWKGKRYAGTENGKDKCIPVKEFAGDEKSEQPRQEHPITVYIHSIVDNTTIALIGEKMSELKHGKIKTQFTLPNSGTTYTEWLPVVDKKYPTGKLSSNVNLSSSQMPSVRLNDGVFLYWAYDPQLSEGDVVPFKKKTDKDKYNTAIAKQRGSLPISYIDPDAGITVKSIKPGDQIEIPDEYQDINLKSKVRGVPKQNQTNFEVWGNDHGYYVFGNNTNAVLSAWPNGEMMVLSDPSDPKGRENCQRFAKQVMKPIELDSLRPKLKNKIVQKMSMIDQPMNEGVIVGHDANDPEVAVLGGAGTMSLSRLKKKAQGEAEQLANDLARGRFKAAAYNIKQLANTLNTIKAAEEEMEKKYFGEDYTGEFAAEKTPAINPYGGLKDTQHRGAISETPTDNPTGASGEGGWRTVKLKSAGTNVEEDTAYAGGMGQGGNAGQSYRKFKPKSAGTFKEEEQLDEKCWDSHKQVGMKKKGDKMVPNCVPKESAIMKGLKR